MGVYSDQYGEEDRNYDPLLLSGVANDCYLKQDYITSQNPDARGQFALPMCIDC